MFDFTNEEFDHEFYSLMIRCGLRGLADMHDAAYGLSRLFWEAIAFMVEAGLIDF